MINKQQGIGLIEVLIALLLLGIAVLGFTALQLRSVSASIEAGNNVQATNLARDMAERMRVNREGVKTYGATYTRARSNKNCTKTTVCTPTEMAAYDFRMVQSKAQALGMDMAIHTCPGTFKLHCIYVAWDNTTPTNGSNADKDCTKGTSYHPKAKCVMLEAFRYD